MSAKCHKVTMPCNHYPWACSHCVIKKKRERKKRRKQTNKPHYCYLSGFVQCLHENRVQTEPKRILLCLSSQSHYFQRWKLSLSASVFHFSTRTASRWPKKKFATTRVLYVQTEHCKSLRTSTATSVTPNVLWHAFRRINPVQKTLPDRS